MRLAILSLLCALAGAPALAAEVSVTVTDARGAPVADAVVALYPAGGGARPRSYGQPLQISQHDLAFHPFVLLAPVGAEVEFPNEDKVLHQVYSFSPAKRFELKLYGREAARTVRFDKAGVVALGCNIHDSMVAFVKVVDAPLAAKTDRSGRAVLRGAPGGSAELRVWHPYAKARDGEVTETVSLPAAGGLERAVRLDLRTPPLRSHAY